MTRGREAAPMYQHDIETMPRAQLTTLQTERLQ